MKQTITVPAGTKLKIDGQRYQTIAETVADGVELSPLPPAGGNHWLALYCPDPECRAYQEACKRKAGKLHGRTTPYVVVRANRSADDADTWTDLPDKSARPFCGVCSTRMVYVPVDGPSDDL